MEVMHCCKIAGSRVYKDNKEYFVSAGNLNDHKTLRLLYDHLRAPYKKYHKMDLYCKTAYLLNEILEKPLMNENADNVAVVMANNSGSLITDIQFNSGIQTDKDFFPSPAAFVYTLPNIMIGELCIRNKIYGENAFFMLEKYEADRLFALAEQVCSGGGTQFAIIGWIDPMCKNGNYGELSWVRP